MTDHLSSYALGDIIITEVCLTVMAVVAIIIGSLKSVDYVIKLKGQGNDKELKILTLRDAVFLPLQMAGVLLFFYVSIKMQETNKSSNTSHVEEEFDIRDIIIFSIIINLLPELLRPMIEAATSSVVPNTVFKLSFTKERNGEVNHLVNKCFSYYNVLSVVFCSLLGAWHLLTKNWFLNNLIGIALAVSVIKKLLVNRMLIGCVLTFNLILYDVFMVFVTDVMDTVVFSLNAPIMLKVPIGSLNPFATSKGFYILGLGDIVVPGIVAAYLLRFDNSLKRGSCFYFFSSLTGYVLGLVVTFVFCHLVKESQPALLYLIPSCVGLPLICAFARKDLTALFRYEDFPESDLMENNTHLLVKEE